MEEIEQSLDINFNYIKGIYEIKLACSLVYNVMEEVLTISRTIYKNFNKAAYITEQLDKISTANKTYYNSEMGHVNNVKIDHDNVEIALFNISKILRAINRLYFYLQKLQTDIDDNSITFFNKSRFDTFLDEIRSTYENFEVYFINTTTEKALNSKPIDVLNNIEMLVDDFFFVVGAILMRSVSTLDLHSLSNIIDYVVIVTKLGYMNKALSQISKLIPRVLNQDIIRALHWFNSLDTGSSYALKLAEKIKHELSQPFNTIYGASPDQLSEIHDKIKEISITITEKKNVSRFFFCYYFFLTPFSKFFNRRN